MKKWLSPTLIVLLVAFIYRNSFVSPFFQDDKILLGLFASGNIFQVIPNFPYRPISQSLFYFLSQQFFGQNVIGYHLVLFGAFAATIFVVFCLAEKLLKNKTSALAATFFYALNISLFANFYWVATSYFSLGALFFFLTVFFYLEKKTFLTVTSYLLALGSNELAFVLPLIFAALGWYINYWPKKIVFFLLSLPILLWLRLLVGLPQATNYSLSASQSFATFRWYVIRALNLPEGVQRSSDFLLTVTFVLVVSIFLVSFWHHRPNFRLLLLGAAIFILAALPFFFLPAHMSSYYLTMALFGPALVVGETVTNKRLLAVFLVSYFLLTIRGLDFLSKTHWIILKNTGPIGQF